MEAYGDITVAWELDWTFYCYIASVVLANLELVALVVSSFNLLTDFVSFVSVMNERLRIDSVAIYHI